MSDLDYTKQELLEIAMVLKNMKEKIDKSPSTKAATKITVIRLEADYRNPDNEYYRALQPLLDYVDEEEGNTVAGLNVDIRHIENKVLNIVREQEVLGGEVIVKTKRVKDPVGFGVLEDETISYDMSIYVDRFEDYYKQITDAAQTKMLIPAELSLGKVSTPFITVSERKYELPAMRDGNAYIIVHYCYKNLLGKEVSLDSLKEKLPINGVTNINQSLKNSPFDPNHGILRAFIESEPKIITVNKSALITNKDFKAIVSASKK